MEQQGDLERAIAPAAPYLAGLAAVYAAHSALLWLAGELVGWLWTRRCPPADGTTALTVLAHVLRDPGHPSLAWPAVARHQFARFLTPANSVQTCANHQEPHVVVEVIPQHPHGLVFRANNADAGGFVTPATPAPGDHVVVTRPHVIDTNVLHRALYQGRPAENWAEMHPAWAIRVDRRGGPGQPNQFGPGFGG